MKKIFFSFILFLLFLGFAVIPLTLYFLIPIQGTKILKTPVTVKSVFFNPFTLDLKINGLEISDHQKMTIAGFQSLEVDVSLIDLVKGKYHVQKIDLDGLRIAAVLGVDGHINLLDLVNNAIPTGAVKDPVKDKNAGKTTTEDKLPMVLIDKVLIRNGAVYFNDQSITPNFVTHLHDMNLTIDSFSTDPQASTRVNFKALLDDKGVITNEAVLKPLSVPLYLETTFSLNAYALTILSPYVGKYTGHALNDGKFDLVMTYRISDNKLVANHKILVQHFKFGENVVSKDALHLPVSLAIALLEDPQGRIKITLPVKGDMSDPKFEYWHLVGQVVSNFFTKLVTKPFMMLASIIGGTEESTDELGSVLFTPGQFDLSAAEKDKLKTLVKGLNERPKLKLQINGSYDQELDWRAIKTQIFDKDYKQLREDSKRDDSLLYRQLYQRRFGIRALWHLAKKYKESMGVYKDEDLDKEMKKQLIENAPADRGAMDVLAKARAQVVFNALVSLGFDQKRLDLGTSQSVLGVMGQVPLEFTLTVIE